MKATFLVSCVLAAACLALLPPSVAGQTILLTEELATPDSIFERPRSADRDANAGMLFCPDLVIPDPSEPSPPANFTFLTKPALKPGANYTWYLIDAIHSLNPTWLFEKIICKYAACPSYGCPTVGLLSVAQYSHPDAPQSNWGKYSRINDTLICAPIDHLAVHCPFG